MFLLLNTSCPLFSRYTLAGVNAVKEVQVTRDMTDCTKKNGPLQKTMPTHAKFHNLPPGSVMALGAMNTSTALALSGEVPASAQQPSPCLARFLSPPNSPRPV